MLLRCLFIISEVVVWSGAANASYFWSLVCLDIMKVEEYTRSSGRRLLNQDLCSKPK
ncbi:hypothetical protein HanHA300_Chr03g0088281 [Helianthus annuus]|nr:hypothetical protein HanHA300_Chr03g0088281 [Helianthus annuus]KAJ0607707.1 hypothetical protein HanHA89_Chr03g0099871 [Helianthus annuus]KAJ0767772.1 hypothetical protein HanLR1_Chr03g0093251 [Helianthus annuus]